MIKETTTTANMAVSGNNIDNNSKSMVLKSMKDNYYYTLVEKLEKLTGKKVVLEKKSKYLKVKDHIAKMHIPAELKEKILDLVNSGTRVSDKHPIIHGLTKPADFNKRVKEHNLPTGYELGADKNGFFVATHRARSKSYENVVDIPIKSIKFIDSTG